VGSTHRIEVDGVSLRVVEEGTGPPVLLLHGFPDSADMWRHQIPVLAAAGFRVVAPDLRGFGESDKPPSTSAYAMDRILGDLRGVLDALGIGRVHVVGHDWGAIAAWALAGWEPDRVRRLVAISVGHPRSWARPSLSQLRRSWYAVLFQVPGLAERLFRARDWALLRATFGGSPDFDRYLADLSRPGALRAGLSWYRANMIVLQTSKYPRVKADTLGIWGSKENMLTEEQMTGSARYVDGAWRYERVRAGHWAPLSRPDVVNELLLDFLA
jgi:pimeloyl-ACP methyl ester carboxylesterase